MGTKTISVMDDAYALLRSEKKSGESFSDVIRKNFARKRSIMEFAGAWKGLGDKEVARVKVAVAELRSRSTKELLKHYDWG